MDEKKLDANFIDGTADSTAAPDLTARLRAAADKSANGGGEWFQLVHRCREAADLIDAQAARIAELEALPGNYVSKHVAQGVLAVVEWERDAALADVAKLREALNGVLDDYLEGRWPEMSAERNAQVVEVLADTEEANDG